MGSPLGYALRRLTSTIGVGVILVGFYVGFNGLRHHIGREEVRVMPVLAAIAVCDGDVDKRTGQCLGQLVEYGAFEQTAARCDGRDAIVSGTMSKVRPDATYIEGRQAIFFGTPGGPFRRAFFEFEDHQQGTPANRPAGVQDWGPWRLSGGCVTLFRSWFTSVEHEPWHGLWPLQTISGPFPLPEAKLE